MARQYTLHTHTPAHASGIDYPAALNAEQYAAVSSPPCRALVIAGAGSGKTRTLTYRVAWLLDHGIDARQILLLTFTNKAAREMTGRVRELATTPRRLPKPDVLASMFSLIENTGSSLEETIADLIDLYQKRFRHILVDEYQDTNHVQGGMIDLLAGETNSLMCVGDDAQSIYLWRGADMSLILGFPQRYPGAVVRC